ncbi:MAG: polymer-forming cytoskeletal protein [Phycisphaeraceae bacterium]|nr:polymer-forming cytoskeletal protein [Phycisphaeraceae bacterium]
MSDAPKSKTVLGPDCRISGELSLDNDAIIMGQFKGTLRVSGTLELSESAEVSGTIIVGTLRLAGNVEADVVAEDAVELLPGAQLIGQLFTSRLNIVEGATFQGEICVGPKAMQAASEAFGQGEHQEAEQTMLSSMMSQSSETEETHHEQPSPVRTNTSSVNAVLARRRPKVLTPRNGIGIPS